VIIGLISTDIQNPIRTTPLLVSGRSRHCLSRVAPFIDPGPPIPGTGDF
jgi:hypothetical protein